RGRLVSLNQFAIVTGILLAQIANWQIARPVPDHLSHVALMQSWNVQYGWRWMFCAVVAPAVIFTVTSFFIPESPRWLLTKGKDASASEVLTRIGGPAYALHEAANIKSSLDHEAGTKASWRELSMPGIRKIVLIGVSLAVLQQWTGINII